MLMRTQAAEQLAAGETKLAGQFFANARLAERWASDAQKMTDTFQHVKDYIAVNGPRADANAAIRRQVLPILRKMRKNPGAYTADEIRAANEVVSGTPWGNHVRGLGGALPDQFSLDHNGVLYGFGLGSRGLANATTRNNANRLRATILNDGIMPPAYVPPLTVRDAIARTAVLGSVTAGMQTKRYKE